MKKNSFLIGWIVLIVGLLCSVRGGGCEFGGGVEKCFRQCNGGWKCCDVDGNCELE